MVVRRIGIALSGMVVAVAHVGAQNAKVPGQSALNNGAMIRVELAENTVKAGAPVVVKVSVLNHSDDVLLLSSEVGVSLLDSEVFDGNGKTPLETEMGCKVHLSKKCGPKYGSVAVGKRTGLELRPHKEYSYTVTLSNEYRLDQPGVYSIVFKEDRFRLYQVPPGGDLSVLGQYNHTNVGPVRSNTVKVEVTP